jgi:hypothetical protein
VLILYHTSPLAIQSMFAKCRLGCQGCWSRHSVTWITSVGWSIDDASVSMWLQSSWPVRARTPLLPLSYSAHAIHTCAPNNMPRLPASASRTGKIARTPGNDFPEMEDSTRADEPGVPRKP